MGAFSESFSDPATFPEVDLAVLGIIDNVATTRSEELCNGPVLRGMVS